VEKAFTILREECRRGWWDLRVVIAFEEMLASMPSIRDMAVAAAPLN
jgi:hypothetical protein